MDSGRALNISSWMGTSTGFVEILYGIADTCTDNVCSCRWATGFACVHGSRTSIGVSGNCFLWLQVLWLWCLRGYISFFNKTTCFLHKDVFNIKFLLMWPDLHLSFTVISQVLEPPYDYYWLLIMTLTNILWNLKISILIIIPYRYNNSCFKRIFYDLV